VRGPLRCHPIEMRANSLGYVLTFSHPSEKPYCVTGVPELLKAATVALAPAVSAEMGSTMTDATPARFMPTSSAARSERSMINRRIHGPRSLILTITERPLSRLVTLA